MLKIGNSDEDVEVIEHTVLCQSFFRLDCYRLRHRMFEGGWSEVIEREVFERGKCAAALLFDPGRDQVVLVEQFRTGVFAAGDAKPWTLELVAGILEPEEEVIDLVKRESREESGLEIQALSEMPNIYSSPGGSSEYVYMFCAKVDASKAGGIHGKNDEGEDIRVVTMALDEALTAIDDGRINTAFTMYALLWLARNKSAVVKGWD